MSAGSMQRCAPTRRGSLNQASIRRGASGWSVNASTPRRRAWPSCRVGRRPSRRSSVSRRRKRRVWSQREIARLVRLYPGTSTARVAALLDRPLWSVNGKAWTLGLKKSARYMRAMIARVVRKLSASGRSHRFKPGQRPFNKGLKGWQAGGRSRETQFKPGSVSAHWDPETYHVGALRLDADGYVDMKIKEGLRAWRAFHVIIWEEANGPLPKGHILRFRDGDVLNIEIDNLELITRAENMRRNTIHRYPPALKSAIRLVGKLKRTIREEQDRRP